MLGVYMALLETKEDRERFDSSTANTGNSCFGLH